jgi:hypothetical protein
MRTPQEVFDLKIKMEKILEKNVGKWFYSVIEETAKQVRRAGAYAVYIPIELKPELQRVIKNHYLAVTRANLPQGMSTKSESELSKYIRKVVAEIEDDVEIQTDKKIEKQVDIIFTSANRRIKRIAILALMVLAKETDNLSNETLEKIFKNIAKDRVAGQARGIATVETGWVAELTRQTAVKKVTENMVVTAEEYIKESELTKPELLKQKMETLAGFSERESGKTFVQKVETYVARGSTILASGAVTAFAVIKKQWITMGDELVRLTHKAVNLVILPIDEYFIVGAYEMKHPLDTSRGAGAEEIAECRCLCMYL